METKKIQYCIGCGSGGQYWKPATDNILAQAAEYNKMSISDLVSKIEIGEKLNWTSGWEYGLRIEPQPLPPREFKKRQICKKCGSGDGMFTTIVGSGICDDCI